MEFYHEHPDKLLLQSQIAHAEPGRLRLHEDPFFPGGGGQLPDKGEIVQDQQAYPIERFEFADGKKWIILEDKSIQLEIGDATAKVDQTFRMLMSELHTCTHILNAYVFQRFEGALVTGVQMSEDGTARMDFDLPDADNDAIRSLVDPINEAIRSGINVTDEYVDLETATATHGLIRSKSVAPPPTGDGLVRIVNIDNLDRQACGGTHLRKTDEARMIRIKKVENKGRQNRRVRIEMVD